MIATLYNIKQINSKEKLFVTGKKHLAKFRVYYEDTDAGGVIYYANYLKFAERARTDFLRESGFDHVRLAKEKNLFYVVKKAEIDYENPGRIDDLLTVETTLTRIGKSSVDMEQTFHNQDGLSLASAKVLIVMVKNTEDGKIKSHKMPVEIIEFFSEYLK